MTLEDVAKKIERLRADLLFPDHPDNDVAGGASTGSPFADQHFLAALALLESAHRQMKLAALHHAKHLADLAEGRARFFAGER